MPAHLRPAPAPAHLSNAQPRVRSLACGDDNDNTAGFRSLACGGNDDTGNTPGFRSLACGDGNDDTGFAYDESSNLADDKQQSGDAFFIQIACHSIRAFLNTHRCEDMRSAVMAMRCTSKLHRDGPFLPLVFSVLAILREMHSSITSEQREDIREILRQIDRRFAELDHLDAVAKCRPLYERMKRAVSFAWSAPSAL